MNPFLTKLADTDHSETNKAFAKTLLYGGTGTIAGGIGGHLISNSSAGAKAGAAIAKSGVGKAVGSLATRFKGTRVGAAMVGATGLGALIGSHMGSAGGDYAAAHSIVNKGQTKKAEEVNIYLVKAAGIADAISKAVASKGAGVVANAGIALKGALKTPVGKGVAIGAGGVLAGMGLKKALSSDGK